MTDIPIDMNTTIAAAIIALIDRHESGDLTAGASLPISLASPSGRHYEVMVTVDIKEQSPTWQ
jgi:hypothetical protein